MTFLSFTKILCDDGAKVIDGVLNPIPGRCRKCGAFRFGECVSTPGISQCKHGYSVYYDERSQHMFFGARVEGFHDTKKVTCSKVPVYLTQKQFVALIQYDTRRLNQSQFEKMVDAFSEQYDRIIRQIKGALPRYDQESIVYLESKSVEQIYRAVNALDDLKRSTETFVFQYPTLSLFPMVASAEESVFGSEDVCRECKSRACEKATPAEAFSCHMCENGCSYCSFQHRRFFGVRIIGYYKKALCKSSTSRKRVSRFETIQIRQLIEYQVHYNEVIYSIKRFLHDIGQYLFGMGNLMPPTRTNGNVSCTSSDIRSIAAFVSALKSLQREYFRNRNPTIATDCSSFEPFPLFYKYRLCFECRDVKIEVEDLNQEPGNHEHERIEGPVGFEFIALNLISNAVKYLPHTDSKYRTIRIVLKKDEIGLTIEVSSWGPKVDEFEISFLGERGFRSKWAQRVDSSGQGLGLSRIVGYVKRAGFQIRFSSDENAIVCGNIPYSMFKVSILIPLIFCKGHCANDLVDVSSSMSFD